MPIGPGHSTSSLRAVTEESKIQEVEIEYLSACLDAKLKKIEALCDIEKSSAISEYNLSVSALAIKE